MQGCSGTGNVALSDAIITPNVALQLEQYDDLVEQNKKMQQLTKYVKKDVRRISKLGEGCFTNVFLVVSQSEQQKMALKCVDHKKIRSTQEFLTASRDLICEASMLSQLDHEHIINMRGVCMSSFSASYIAEEGEGYFMMMDVISCTLKDQIRRWRNEPSSYRKRSLKSRLMNKGSGRLKIHHDHMKDRMEVIGLCIADAMTYVHRQEIIFRNLTPDTIGFNEVTGKVCLFDFGAARYLEDNDQDAISGSPNYMAPEVMKAQGYSLASDVYSFAMVLYEICSLRKLGPRANSKPFQLHHGSTSAMLARQTGFEARPSLDCIPCKNTQYLIDDCWSSNPEERPSFKQICKGMREVLLAKVDGSGRDLSQSEATFSSVSETE